jgi:hypothetical protein
MRKDGVQHRKEYETDRVPVVEVSVAGGKVIELCKTSLQTFSVTSAKDLRTAKIAGLENTR